MSRRQELNALQEKGKHNMITPIALLVEGMSRTGCESNIRVALTSLEVGYRMVGS